MHFTLYSKPSFLIEFCMPCQFTLVYLLRIRGTCCSKCCIELTAEALYTSYYYYLHIFICPIAIAYSMGQIIKSFCICARVCPSVDTLTVAFLRRFSPNWTQTCKPPKVRTSSLGSISPHLPLLSPLKLPFLTQWS